MGLKVEDSHYSSVTELYIKQIDKLEADIEDFKTICDSIFADNNFGACLQEVLMEMYLNFYETSGEQLKTLITAADAATKEFLEDIELYDKF